MFRGSITALITPFRNGEIDWDVFDNLVEWQIEQGTHALVACGTTAESPTLTEDEHNTIVERCIDLVKGRIPVIVGTGSPSTAKTIASTQHAKDAGADAALIVTPYYNKPPQEGMYAHYKAINNAVALPVIIYNIPGRCVVDMNLETMSRLAELPHIVGVKDATADLTRPSLLRSMVGPDFCQLSGEDGTAAGFLAQGGHGCISVLSNIAPAECARMQDAWADGDRETFESLRDLLAPLTQALFCETSPAPVKYAASQLGLCTDEVRLPLVPATQNARRIVDEAMKRAGLGAVEETKTRIHG
jgi:4-hydroxy-tetrahydrodipicolinate synthase